MIKVSYYWITDAKTKETVKTKPKGMEFKSLKELNTYRDRFYDLYQIEVDETLRRRTKELHFHYVED